MRRSNLVALIALGIVVFVVVSALLARAFSVDGAEQSAITSVLQAEARGDAAGVVGADQGLRRERRVPGARGDQRRDAAHPGR